MKQGLRTFSTKELIEFLAASELFAGLEEALLNELVFQIRIIDLSAGEVLFYRGDPGGTMYLLKQGELQVIEVEDENNLDKIPTQILPGETVGEIAFLTGEKHNVTVRAAVDSLVLMLSAAGLEKISLLSEKNRQIISERINQRLQHTELHNILFADNFFSGMNKMVLRELETELDILMFADGKKVFAKDEISDCLYIIISGRLRVTDDQGHTVIKQGKGRMVGEMGLLTGENRTATVYTVRDSLLARLSKSAFTRLLQKYPQQIMEHFAGNVISDLWRQTQGRVRVDHSVANIAIVAITKDAPLQEFCTRLAEALAKLGSTLYLNADVLDRYLSPKGIAQTAVRDANNINITRWLGKQESEFKYIVYQADPAITEWTKRCVRQADRILLLADDGASPEISKIEKTLLSRKQHKELHRSLILLHNDKKNHYPGAGLWLAERPVKNHYHIHLSSDREMGRLSRLLTGNGVGLVISGGGARALAHIGAIRAMHEAGFVIDQVGGTSIGAIIAAMLALDWDFRTMMHKAGSIDFYIDYTFPVVSLASGNSFTKAMFKDFGGIHIEDLGLNYFCISTDIANSRSVIHQQGELWKYIRASASIPGLFPPIVEEKRMLVDGGIVNNLPVDIMRNDEDIGCVIALDITKSMPVKSVQSLQGSLSGWQVLALRFNPFKHTLDVPSISKMLAQASLIKSIESNGITENMADLYFRLPVGQFGLLAFNHQKELAAVGYRYVQEQINALRRINDPDVLRIMSLSGSDNDQHL